MVHNEADCTKPYEGSSQEKKAHGHHSVRAVNETGTNEKTGRAEEGHALKEDAGAPHSEVTSMDNEVREDTNETVRHNLTKVRNR